MKLRAVVERAEAPRTLGGFPVQVVNVEQSGMDEAYSDVSGLMAASSLNRSFIITADLAEGGRKRFRVRAQSERVAREKFLRHHAQAHVISVEEEGLSEFAPAGSGGDVPPRGPRTPGRDPWGGDDPGEDPYSRPSPKPYRRSIDFFGRFEADHFDREDFDERTGVFKGYWQEDDGSFTQIAYFKFDDAQQAARDFDDSPGMGWYYEPQNESVVKQIVKLNKDLDEAIKLNAPQELIPRDQLQAYADRIKTGTKTKRDKFAPIIHGSNIKAITKDDGGTEWDLDDLAKQITTRPRAILGTNAKMEKSKTEGEIIYDLTLPALSGIVVDEDTGDFVEIKTCPGAGECQLFCYARKGGYVMFPASSMSAAQALNFLVNDPEGYMATVNQEITALKAKTDRAGIQLVVRWHDAGDFFSKEYLDLAYDIARANPDVKFYAYTKMGDVATGSHPPNFIINFSSGSKSREVKKVELHKQAGNVVKQGVTVPKDMFFDLIARKGNSLIKDAKGRTQFASPEALETFKDRLAQQYKVPRDSIITYDEMLAKPEGPRPQWNVIVQPGAGDRAANRLDVIDSYLMFH